MPAEPGADEGALAAALEAVNAASPFNRLAGFRVVAAQAGAVVLAGAAAPELTNHAGALHAGAQSALIDTACGFAAGTVAGNVVTLQLNVQFLSSARGDRFEARARVTKAGRSQLFAEAQLFALRGEEEALVASGTAVLAKLD
jgi:uncharacterized protein (TIGR00369 family)